MHKFVVTNDLSSEDMNKPAFDLMDEVKKKLLTPDIQAAIAAGCNVEVFTEETDKGMTITMRTKEKVSMMRHPNGQIISVLVDRRK